MIVTLMLMRGDYCLEADRTGAVQAFRSWPDAFHAYSSYVNQGSIHLGALIDEGERNYRLVELLDETALTEVEAALVDRTLYRNSGIVGNWKWFYKIKPEIGMEWDKKGEWVRK